MNNNCTLTALCDTAQNIISTLRYKLPINSLKKLNFSDLKFYYPQEFDQAVEDTAKELVIDTETITNVLKIHPQ